MTIIAVFGCCLALYVFSCANHITQINQKISRSFIDPQIEFIMEKLRQNRARYSHKPLLVTDQQMYAFRLGYTVPPSLAVTSFKRRASGQLRDSDVLRVIDEYKPEAVLLREVQPEALQKNKTLRDNYIQVEEAELILYFRE